MSEVYVYSVTIQSQNKTLGAQELNLRGLVHSLFKWPFFLSSFSCQSTKKNGVLWERRQARLQKLTEKKDSTKQKK